MNAMHYRPIPQHPEMKLSEVSLGCWTMGGLNWQEGRPSGWAAVEEEEVTEAVRQAVEAGVNHFDNADVYGNGHAERMLARVFRKLGLRSTDYHIATKVGHLRGSAPHAYDPFHIRRQCEQSLRNLEREYIDIYYFHHGNFGPDGVFLEAAAETMDALVKEGKVRVKGQSAYSESDFTKAVPVVRPALLQSWANAMDTHFIAPGSVVGNLMECHNLAFVAFSPLAQGLLLDKYDPANPPVFEPGDNRANNPNFKAERLAQIHRQLGPVKARFGPATSDLAAVALRFVLGFPRVCCVIPGFRNPRQVACNLAAADRRLTPEDTDFLRAAYA